MSLKLEKLVSSADYSNTLRRFNIQTKKNGLVLKAKTTNLSKARIGYNIPKKGTRHAHRRNRLKRIIKEYFRLNASNLPKMDYVLILKKELTDDLLIETLANSFAEVGRAYSDQKKQSLRFSL